MGINTVDYSTMSVEGTAKNIATECSPPIPPRARGATVTIEQAAVRYRGDGTAPTASEGHKLDIGDGLVFDSWTVPTQNWRSVLGTLQFIQAVASTTGLLKISWFD